MRTPASSAHAALRRLAALAAGARKPRVAVLLLAAAVLLGLAGAERAAAAPAFGPKTDFATGTYPRSVTSADFDNDGDHDFMGRDAASPMRRRG